MNKDALKRWLIAAGVRAVKTAGPDGRDAHRLDRRGHHVARLGPDRGRGRMHRSGIGTHLNRRSPGGRGGYLAVCDAALALLAASVLVFLSLELGMPQVRTAGKAIPTVYDKDAPAQVPTYLQTDERWGALPYAGTTSQRAAAASPARPWRTHASRARSGRRFGSR